MNGIIFCVCWTSAFSVPPIVRKWCRKERKKTQVKKESKKNQSRWWICARDTAQGIQTCLPRLHQKAQGKTRYESQFPLSSWTEQHPRTVRPVEDACSSDHPEWNIDEKWSSQEWKSDEMLEARTERPVGGQPAGPFTQRTDKFVIDDDDMDSDTATESNLSLKSRSFLHRVNARLRKILVHSLKDAMQDIDKRSLIWWMFMSSTLEASVFMGKNDSENVRSSKNTGNNLTMKQMFDISEKWIVWWSDEIFGVTQINWEDSSWKHLSLVNDEEVISLCQILCYVLKRWIRTQHAILSGRTSWLGSKVHHSTELWTQLMVSRWNSSGIFSQHSPHCSSGSKSKSSCRISA